MSTKKVSIGVRPTRAAAAAAAPEAADAWVKDRATGDEPEKMKRLTIDVTEGLHRLIKTSCATRGVKMADEIRELLLQKYGNP